MAGIGLHPDGNVLSALLTDGEGLVIKAPDGVCRPPTNGTGEYYAFGLQVVANEGNVPTHFGQTVVSVLSQGT